MPDLTYEIVSQCVEDRDRVWTIGGYRQNYVYYLNEFECTCKGYQFRKSCKHLKELESKRCTWHSMFSEEEQTEEGKCPVCGGATEYVRFAV